MLLAVNIGNSNIRFAIAEKTNIKLSWTISTKPYKTAGEFYMIFQTYAQQYNADLKRITAVVVGSVVPHQTQIIAKVLGRILQIKPTIVTRDTPTAVRHSSNQMGTDLYANAVAGHYLYPNKAKIIIDFGTALTFIGVNPMGEILGTIIAPGVITAMNALVGNTAQLPDVELKEPKAVLGMDTETSMQSGIVYGYTAMVEGIIERIKQTYQEDFWVIATGGVGHIYKNISPKIDVDDKFHTVRGLCLLHEMATNKSVK